MGLDMYLTAERYVSEWSNDELRTKLNSLSEGISSTWGAEGITYEVGYWRKSNQIHNWFVKNVQDGVDDCKKYHVSHEDILELYNTVCEVLNDRGLASELLPTQSGFFFGGTDIDEWYFGDLENTKRILEPLVEMIQDEEKVKELYDYDFYYHSSW